MEIVSVQKYIHTSPRKLRLVADMVRKMKPSAALISLRFASEAAADPLSKAIKTAVANANQQKAAMENLTFKTLEINEAPGMRRMRAGARGRGKPYRKKMSHIRVILSDEKVATAAEKPKEDQAKESK